MQRTVNHRIFEKCTKDAATTNQAPLETGTDDTNQKQPTSQTDAAQKSSEDPAAASTPPPLAAAEASALPTPPPQGALESQATTVASMALEGLEEGGGAGAVRVEAESSNDSEDE